MHADILMLCDVYIKNTKNLAIRLIVYEWVPSLQGEIWNTDFKFKKNTCPEEVNKFAVYIFEIILTPFLNLLSWRWFMNQNNFVHYISLLFFSYYQTRLHIVYKFAIICHLCTIYIHKSHLASSKVFYKYQMCSHQKNGLLLQTFVCSKQKIFLLANEIYFLVCKLWFVFAHYTHILCYLVRDIEQYCI